MASLKLSDSAFGSVGLTIDENIDLAELSATLSALLGQAYQLDSLDVSNITQGGLPNFDIQLGTGGLTAVGLGLAGSRLTIGAFDTFFSSFALEDPLSLTGFETLAFTAQTVAPFIESVPRFDIFDGQIIDAPFEQLLTFDDSVRVFDFSAVGTGPLAVRLDAIAPGDTVDSPPFSGYRIIGNDGDTVVEGNSGFEDVSYYGSNIYILGEGSNVFLGGSDNAHVTGGSGPDALFGGFGDDILLGGAGNDVLFGGQSFNFGTSTLDGGEGNDWLYGSRGNHELTGGAGNDRFIFANAYDIVTGVQGEGGSVIVNTEAAVSDGQSGTNVITDFTVGADLLVFVLDDFMLLANPDIPLSLDVLQQAGNLGGATLNFSNSFNEVGESFTIEDTGGAMGVGNFIFRVEQSTGQLGDRQFLNESVLDNNQETFFDGAFEIVYRSAGQSQGADYDRFEWLSIQPTALLGQEPDGPIAGQDKFDLTALGLTDFVVDGGTDTREILNAEGVTSTVAGTEVAVEDILFTDVEFNYLLDALLGNEPPTDTSDFFLDSSDPDNPVYRAMHVEYSNIDGEEFMVYIDADRNGGFDLETDMVFFVRLDSDGTALNDVTDLFNPGGGTGIFIFDESQYDFWLTDDLAVIEPAP